MAKRARHAVLLTGTPLVARAQDAHPLLDGLLDLCSPADFAQRYGPRRLQELHVLLAAVMLRRTKAATLQQLPPKRRQKVLLDMAPEPPTALGLEEASERLRKSKSAAVADYMACLVSADAPRHVVGPVWGVIRPPEVRFLVFAHHLAMLDDLEGSAFMSG